MSAGELAISAAGALIVARHPGRPTSILGRHHQGGEPSERPDLVGLSR